MYRAEEALPRQADHASVWNFASTDLTVARKTGCLTSCSEIAPPNVPKVSSFYPLPSRPLCWQSVVPGLQDLVSRSLGSSSTASTNPYPWPLQPCPKISCFLSLPRFPANRYHCVPVSAFPHSFLRWVRDDHAQSAQSLFEEGGHDVDAVKVTWSLGFPKTDPCSVWRPDAAS